MACAFLALVLMVCFKEQEDAYWRTHGNQSFQDCVDRESMKATDRQHTSHELDAVDDFRQGCDSNETHQTLDSNKIHHTLDSNKSRNLKAHESRHTLDSNKVRNLKAHESVHTSQDSNKIKSRNSNAHKNYSNTSKAHHTTLKGHHTTLKAHHTTLKAHKRTRRSSSGAEHGSENFT
uniref:Secreted protein n=1 Tax=Cacopsylla melanoneura TaxID=428564 RepID=A0A8D8X429_9HEMI